MRWLLALLILSFLVVVGGLIFRMSRSSGNAPDDGPVSTNPPPDDTHTETSPRSNPSSDSPLFPGELIGFGEGTVGGEGGPVYTVTSFEDSGPGTLREALQRKDGPLIVRFDRDGEIQLQSRIGANSHKTIDGRGKRVFITGYGIQFQKGEHCIVRNVHFRRNRGDAFEINESSHVWIHECTFGDTRNLSDGDEPDGMVDIVIGSHDVTVSHCYAFDHNKAFLVSYNGATRITFHHNYFLNLIQRTPMVRGRSGDDEPGEAWVHVYNNYMESSGPIQGHGGSNLLVENNVFKNGRRWATCEDPPLDVCRWGTRSLRIRGSKLIGNMTHASERNPNWVFDPPYAYTLDDVETVEREVPKLKDRLLSR